MLTHAYAGATGVPSPVASSDQDHTPDHRLFDLAGNVQEWTINLWREDVPGQDESWVEDSKTGTTFRAIRGLPLAAVPSSAIPKSAATHRESMCATGVCIEKSLKAFAYIGFRCARKEPSR